MKITKIHIEKFRGFQNEDFELGSQLTAIAGQNGTQKSTLLGIVTQTFTLKLDDPMRTEKPLCGGSYISAFKDKFRLSPTFDKPKGHEWTISFDSGIADFTVESIKRTGDPNVRFWKKGARQEGDGYISFPTIFLSLKRLVPAAEESGVNLCIHPDDPPFPLLGLPRIASTVEDLRWILNQVDSVANGLTFCTGSLSVCPTNDLTLMAQEFASRIHFVHLRNTVVFSDHSFYESGQLTGCVDMVPVVRILLEEQYRRKRLGRTDIRIPFRPDHGIKILDDFNRKANPGYPLIGRLKGLAEIDGLQTAIENSLFQNKKVD